MQEGEKIKIKPKHNMKYPSLSPNRFIYAPTENYDIPTY